MKGNNCCRSQARARPEALQKFIPIENWSPKFDFILRKCVHTHTANAMHTHETNYWSHKQSAYLLLHSQNSYLRIFRIIFQLYFGVVAVSSLCVPWTIHNHISYKTQTLYHFCAPRRYVSHCRYASLPPSKLCSAKQCRKMPMTTSRQRRLQFYQNHKTINVRFLLLSVIFIMISFIIFIHLFTRNEVQQEVKKKTSRLTLLQNIKCGMIKL